jgi:P27 family predicted phage terminase small subunit
MPRERKSLAEHALNSTRPQWTETGASVFAGGRPKMPADLSPDAAAEWKRIVKELAKRKTCTRLDSSMLEIHCTMFARWKKCARLAEANPTTEVTWTDKNGEPHTKIIEHPASAMATKLENSLRNSLKELSATPASRERAKPTTQPKRKNELNPNSLEAMHAETDRLRALVAAEREAAANAPAPEDEIDINLIDTKVDL